jgi:hypothetical protein
MNDATKRLGKLIIDTVGVKNTYTREELATIACDAYKLGYNDLTEKLREKLKI